MRTCTRMNPMRSCGRFVVLGVYRIVLFNIKFIVLQSACDANAEKRYYTEERKFCDVELRKARRDAFKCTIANILMRP